MNKIEQGDKYSTSLSMVELVFESSKLVVKILPILTMAVLSKEQEIKDKHFAKIGVEMRLFFEKRGGLFPKFGQLLSHRQDLFPEALCRELLPLTEKVPSFDGLVAQSILEKEVPHLKLKQFDLTPVGAASIAQVHRAVLSTGEEVAIKIQRPQVEQQIKRDLKNLQSFVKIIDFLHVLPPLQDIFEEFKSWMLDQELHFLKEAQNLARAAKPSSFSPVFDTNIPMQNLIPKVYPKYCTDRVLVMQFMKGRTLSNIAKIQDLPLPERKQIVIQALRSFMKQFVVDGFFQADPHLSNLIQTEKGELFFIDWGLVSEFSNQNAIHLLRMYRGFIFKDANLCWDGVTRLMKMSEVDKRKITPFFKRIFAKFASDSRFMLDRPYREAGAEFLIALMHVIVKYKIYIPAEASLAFKTMATTDAVYTSVCPEVTIRDMLEPALDISQLFITKLMAESGIVNLILEKGAGTDGTQMSAKINEWKNMPLVGDWVIKFFNQMKLIDAQQNIEDLLNNEKLLKMRLRQIQEIENLWLSLQTPEEI
ncbi:MAG: hypothetical protein OHK0017_12670 [Patescibacteria group bacterium]